MKKNLNLKEIVAVAALLVITISASAQANTSLSNLVSPTSVNVSLLPKGLFRTSINLGSSSKQWSNLYLEYGLYMNGIKFISNADTTCTFVGARTGYSNSGSTYNSAFGYQALFSNTTGKHNTAYGNLAMYSNTSGTYNVSVGDRTLYYNTTGYFNVGIGVDALSLNISGYSNAALGNSALFANISGGGNTAVGHAALENNTTGNRNTAAGFHASFYNNTGFSNVSVGSDALFNNKSRSNLVAVGDSALYNDTSGIQLSAIGSKALYTNTSGSYNTASGFQSMYANTSGNYNTANGQFSLNENTTGHGNTAIGNNSLTLNTTGYYNTCVGYNAYPLTADLFNYTGIGDDVGTSASASNMVEIGNSSVTVIRGAVNFSTYSDERIKNNIKNNVPGLAFINLLKPVTYNIDLDKEASIVYKNKKSKDNSNNDFAGKYDLGKQLKTGFLAQDVEAAAKKVNYDFSGVVKPQNNNDLYSLRYSEFVVPLVKAVQELSADKNSKDSLINSLQSQVNELKSIVQALANKSGTSISSANISLSSASLEQNAPNPFKGSTTIAYFLPQQYSSAQIIIRDNSGKTLKAIAVTGNGKGSLNIDVATLSDGAYNYSLLVDGKLINTKQMILAK